MIEERLFVAGGITLAIGEFDSYTAGNEPEYDYDDREANELWSMHYANAQREMIHEIVDLAYNSRHIQDFTRDVIDIAHKHSMKMLDEFESDLEEL